MPALVKGFELVNSFGTELPGFGIRLVLRRWGSTQCRWWITSSSSMASTGDDFFADKDVCSIVLEVPNSALGPKEVGPWHRTLVRADGAGGGWVQAERGAWPLQLFLVLAFPGAEREAYLAGEPADDARF